MFKGSKFRVLYLLISLMVVFSFIVSGCSSTPTATPASTDNTAPAATVPTDEPAPADTASTDSTAAPAATTSTEDVRVAFIGPLTGAGSADLILASKGAQLAVDQRNAAGGVCGGRNVKMELYDDKADPKEAALVATSLASDDGIIAVEHGWNSSAVLAAAPIFNQTGIAQMDYYGIAPSIAEAGPYTFRVIPTGDLMAKYLAKWVITDEGYKKVATVYENSDYGISMFDTFAPEVEALGGEVVASEAIDMAQKDFSAIISKFKAAGPDAVVIFGQYEAAAFWVKQAPDIGLSVPLFGSDGIFAPSLINLAGTAAEGIRSVAAYTVESTDPFISDFVTAFRAANNTDPNNGAGYTYDGMMLILNGLDAGNCTRDGVKDYLTNNVQDIQGVTGMITLENRDRKFQDGLYLKLIVKDGVFVAYSK